MEGLVVHSQPQSQRVLENFLERNTAKPTLKTVGRKATVASVVLRVSPELAAWQKCSCVYCSD